MGIFVGSALQQTLVQDLGIVTNPARTLTLNVVGRPVTLLCCS